MTDAQRAADAHAARVVLAALKTGYGMRVIREALASYMNEKEGFYQYGPDVDETMFWVERLLERLGAA